MKILYDTEIFDLQIFGGISLYFSRLFEHFSNEPDVDYTVPIVYSDNRYIMNKHISFYGYDFPFRKQLTKFFTHQNKNNTVKSIIKHDFDLYHPTYFNREFLKYLGNKPFVLTVHDMTVEALPEYFVFDKNAENIIKTKKHLIEKATRIIAISENTKKDILKFTSVNENKIDVIYHGQPFETVEKTEITDIIPEKYILFVGQRSKYKNFVSFLSVISEILLGDKNLHLICAGGFNFNKTEQEIINSLNLTDKVIYTGLESENKLISLYQNSVCFVFPSLYEGFGFPILEAFQCGCPLVCSNTSSFPEVAGDAAQYFDPYSIESIRNSVYKVLYDERLRNELVNKGKERLNSFSWNETTKLTKETYQKVICHG